MKLKSCLILVLILFLTPLSYAQKFLESKWHYAGILKNSEERPLEFYRFDSESQTFYFISNDSDNLYINLKVKDENTQQRVLLSGLKIYFDPKGKYNREHSVQFPVASMNNNGEKEFPANKRTSKISKGRLREICNEKNEIWVTGFDAPIDEELILPAANASGIRGYAQFNDKDELVCQITIPFEKTPKFKLGAPPFSLIIESGGMEDNKSSNRAGETSLWAEPPGGRTRPPMGRGTGMPGIGPSQKPDDRVQPVSKAINIKMKKITLSNPK